MRVALAGLLVALMVAGTIAQQPPQTAPGPTIRVTTRIVPMPTMVTDGQGRLVPDLEQDAFTILDNGKPQEIALFENTVQPFSVVVMLDFSLSMTMRIDLLKEAAEDFLLRMLPADKGQVGAFSDRIQLSGSFTSDRDRLIASLRSLDFGNSTKLWDALDASVATLEPLEGRRVVLVFTDGDDTDSRIGLTAVRDRAQRDDIMIYAIGLRTPRSAGGPPAAPDPGLRKIAEATGGGYFELNKTEDLGPTFTRVAQELHSLYTLGFAPTKLDGKEHKLQIRLKQPDQKVRTRTSYFATAEDRK
jgi:Ca-activated chloride channel family protein